MNINVKILKFIFFIHRYNHTRAKNQENIVLQKFYYKKNQNNSKNASNKFQCNEPCSESPTSILVVRY